LQECETKAGIAEPAAWRKVHPQLTIAAQVLQSAGVGL
jgi:hypothetical protein